MRKKEYPTEEDWRNYYIFVLVVVVIVFVVGILAFSPGFNYRLEHSLFPIIQAYKNKQLKEKSAEDRKRLSREMMKLEAAKRKEQEAQNAAAARNSTKYVKKSLEGYEQKQANWRKIADASAASRSDRQNLK